MRLADYIDQNFGGSRAEFARHMGELPQKVTKWLKSEMIVHIEDGRAYLCTVRREIPSKNNAKKC